MTWPQELFLNKKRRKRQQNTEREIQESLGFLTKGSCLKGKGGIGDGKEGEREEESWEEGSSEDEV